MASSCKAFAHNAKILTRAGAASRLKSHPHRLLRRWEKGTGSNEVLVRHRHGAKATRGYSRTGISPSLLGAKAPKQSMAPRLADPWIASRSLSSGAHSRDPLARNDG